MKHQEYEALGYCVGQSDLVIILYDDMVFVEMSYE